MIYVSISGRLGNQMFQYAFARKLQKANPSETLIFNFDEVHRDKYLSGFFNENQLEYFNTIGTERQDALNYSILQYIVLKVFKRFYPYAGDFLKKNKYERKWLPVMEFFGLYFLSIGYHPFRLKKPWWVKNIIVKGSFECERYFDNCQKELSEHFKPKSPLYNYNRELLEKIRSSNSVAISIRRGDFVDDEKIKSTYFVCDKKYYEDAIELMKEKVKNPVFILFSNDIEWAKKNIKIEGCECFYEAGKDEVWETMRLMSSCKHFIISNSTLHWWAQFLSDNQEKTVIAPSRWYNLDFKSDIYQKNWILLPVSVDRK